MALKDRDFYVGIILPPLLLHMTIHWAKEWLLLLALLLLLLDRSPKYKFSPLVTAAVAATAAGALVLWNNKSTPITPAGNRVHLEQAG